MPTDASIAIPAPTTRTLARLLLSGAAATVAFDLFGQGISPALGYASLAPVPLAQQTLQTVFGAGTPPEAQMLHFFTGLVAYPFGWIYIARPLAARIAPGLGWFLASLAYGVVLWVFAIGFMASIVNPNPFFLGFTGITWIALVGHVLFAVVAAWVLRGLEKGAV